VVYASLGSEDGGWFLYVGMGCEIRGYISIQGLTHDFVRIRSGLVWCIERETKGVNTREKRVVLARMYDYGPALAVLFVVPWLY